MTVKEYNEALEVARSVIHENDVVHCVHLGRNRSGRNMFMFFRYDADNGILTNVSLHIARIARERFSRQHQCVTTTTSGHTIGAYVSDKLYGRQDAVKFVRTY